MASTRARRDSSPCHGRRVDQSILVLQDELLDDFFLGPIGVHVDGIEDALGQVLFLGCWQLGNRKFRKVDRRSLLSWV